MLARTIAKQVAYGRIAVGAALLVKPGLVTGRWLGPVAETPGGRVLAVTFGARDLAVGAGAAYALHTGGAARPWLVAAAFTDTVDALGDVRRPPLASITGRAGHGRAGRSRRRGRRLDRRAAGLTESFRSRFP